jgi:hypothetical protein
VSFDHLVGTSEQRRREFKPNCLRGLLLILNLRLVRSSRDELLAAVDVVRAAYHSPKLTPNQGILVVVTGNFLHEHHDPAPQVGIINSHERSNQP